MKLHSLITCLVLGATSIASAQTATAPQPPSRRSEASITRLPPPAAAQAARIDFSVQAGLLEVAVEQLTAAYPKAVPEKGSGGNPVPTLVYGPGAREARLGAPLHLANLTDVRVVDALALVAAAAGCDLNPIYAPRMDGDESKPHIIGYCIALASNRPSSTPSKTGSESGGAISGGGEEVVGIGVNLETKDGNIVVSEVVPGSTADRMHVLKPGDRILQVNEDGQGDVQVTDLPLEKVAKMICGKPGTPLLLTVWKPDGGTTRVSVVREKLNLTARTTIGNDTANLEMGLLDPLLSHPKVAVVDVGDTRGSTFVGEIKAWTLPQGKAGEPVQHPSPAASPDEDDVQVVRIYATGSILSGNDQGVKEDDFTKLVTQALDLAGLAKRGAPQLYFHAKSRVLIARTSGRGHEIIEQLVNALRKGNEGVLPNPPEQ